MSKISTLFGAAALLVSVSAFAQSSTPAPTDTPHDTKVAPSNSAPMNNNTMNTTTPANNAPAAPSPMASSDMSSAGTDHAKMHHKHRTQTARNSTDKDADKLNACMAYATPTSSQEQCLQKASQS